MTKLPTYRKRFWNPQSNLHVHICESDVLLSHMKNFFATDSEMATFVIKVSHPAVFSVVPRYYEPVI